MDTCQWGHCIATFSVAFTHVQVPNDTDLWCGASVCKGLVKGCHKESRSFNPLNWIVHSIDWHLYHWCIVFLYSCSFIWLTLKQMLRMNEFLFLDNCSLRNGRIRILSFKVAIVLLCNAHLEEKYRCTSLFLVMTFIHSSHETYSDVAEQVSMNETTSKWNYIDWNSMWHQGTSSFMSAASS